MIDHLKSSSLIISPPPESPAKCYCISCPLLPHSPGQELCLLLLRPAQSWSSVGIEAPGWSLHSSLVRTGTVTACRVLECGAPSWTPSLPHPVTVARVPCSKYRESGGRQIEAMAEEGLTWMYNGTLVCKMHNQVIFSLSRTLGEVLPLTQLLDWQFS